MPRFAANLSMTFNEVPFLERFAAARGEGFEAVEFLFPYSYEKRQLADVVGAAYQAGRTRLRPVIMTAMAMLAGMIPMALGFGEGGEQNAPLGRAVIGGLILATIATLFVVPVVYSLVRKAPPKTFDRIETMELELD